MAASFYISFNNDFRQRSPRFKILANPVMRGTMGKVATMEQIASLGGLPLEWLLAEVTAEIKAQSAQDVSVAAEAMPERPERTAPLADPEARLAALKEIIRDLHRGADPEAL